MHGNPSPRHILHIDVIVRLDTGVSNVDLGLRNELSELVVKMSS